MRTFKLESYPISALKRHPDSGELVKVKTTRYTLTCTEEATDRWGKTISDTYPLIIQLTEDELNELESCILWDRK